MDKEVKKINKSNLKLATKDISKTNTSIKSQKFNNKNIKKEPILRGLDCAHCASKIEENVSQIKEISSSNVNFLTKIPTLEIEEANSVQELITATSEKAEKVEPHVKIKEKQSDKVLKKTLILDGLG
jgi:Cd2+/Zn2+-exporting ATPase